MFNMTGAWDTGGSLPPPKKKTAEKPYPLGPHIPI